MDNLDILQRIYIMIMAELGTIGHLPYVDGSIKSYELFAKLDAYANVLSCMGFTKEATVKIYGDFGIDYSCMLDDDLN